MGKKGPTVDVIARVDLINTDRTSYKPYSHQLSPLNLHVKLQVSKEEVVSQSGDMILVTPDGLAELIAQVADALDGMHEVHMDELRKA